MFIKMVILLATSILLHDQRYFFHSNDRNRRSSVLTAFQLGLLSSNALTSATAEKKADATEARLKYILSFRCD